jgi:hypothetical protein
MRAGQTRENPSISELEWIEEDRRTKSQFGNGCVKA